MYEDSSWYSFVPDLTGRTAAAPPTRSLHKRKESLLQQPNGTGIPIETPTFSEIPEEDNGPPEASVVRRANSFTDFQLAARRPARAASGQRRAGPRKVHGDRSWDALDVPGNRRVNELSVLPLLSGGADELLQESRRDYSLYRDQLALTERHIDSLIRDADETLALLTTLSTSFQSVETQTSSFQARCDNLMTEQARLQTLADEVGTNLYYYAYLENVSRRLNAPGASRLAEHSDLADVLDNLEACIEFMSKHPDYRDAESYLARYQALLTKALHILEVGFSKQLETVSQDISRRLGATQSESAQHALAYGRFEEMILDSYSLVPNVRKAMLRVYDPSGNPNTGTASDIYANTAKNMFHSYLATRDRDLRPLVQHELDEFQKEAKTQSLEAACRNHTKQSFERVYNEANLLSKIFSVSPLPSATEGSAFQALKTGQRWLMTPANLKPLAQSLQAALAPAELPSLCNFVGWLTREYLMPEYLDEESPFTVQCCQYTASLLSEYLWTFTDAAFEAETAKSITKADGAVESAHVHSVLKRAVELLGMFDQCMPKERCQQNSPVIFKIVRETISVLQRVEAKMRSAKSDADPDLFMIKNLLVLKNELMSLEIGDIRSHQTNPMQHFSRIWETMGPQNWLGFVGNIVPGSLWSRGSGGPPAVTAKTLTVEDMSEQLDELLRLSIRAFTGRWAARMNGAGTAARGKIAGDLRGRLEAVFGEQPEVVGKLEEAIDISVRALRDADAEKLGGRRY
ncbi:related to conserved oligomeric Golgi complex component 3 [Cephalotrichum gorgonifer]|uniref:Conserved oligomeric Golgi complex subunit 3 n=1 Tax=Cephalotrichum gorgonifer TaxID=2041049 RepID=A0AAE8SX40_9PEZI|nr:related to conserved oligomeric Golgi complex component 3 [Cephalotrichum gorgonifer]